MKMIRAVTAVLLLLALPGLALAGMTLTRSEFARDVTAREPEGVAQNFPPDVGKVFFFNQVAGVDGPTTIKHVWIFDDKVQFEIKLPLEGNGWRVWSSKKISAQQSGTWHVEVMDEAGNVIESATFTVGR